MNANAKALGRTPHAAQEGTSATAEPELQAASIDPAATLATARRVLRTEAEALRSLSDQLPEDFTRVIELPLTMVKIDRRFVSDMLVDVRSRAIVTTLVRLGESLRLDVVAEGVEDVDQAEALRELGCPQGQGYLWARPERPEDFRRRLAAES